jgi:hypothetical protein
MFSPFVFITPIHVYKIMESVVSYVANQWIRMMQALGIKPSCKMMDICLKEVNSSGIMEEEDGSGTTF